MLTQITEDRDLFKAFVSVCDIDTIEALYLCNSEYWNLFNCQDIINVIALSWKINKPFRKFRDLLIEYNHRFRRELSWDCDLKYHLLWAIRDDDNTTVLSLLQEKNGQYLGLRDVFLEAGKMNNSLILEKLTLWPPGKGINKNTLFQAGKAYIGNEIDWDVVENMDDGDISYIIYEAARGGNLGILDKLRSLVKQEGFYQRVILHSYVANDDAENFIKLFESLECNKTWIRCKSKHLDTRLPSESNSPKDELVTHALCNGSYKVLDFLLEKEKSEAYVRYLYYCGTKRDPIKYIEKYQYLNKRWLATSEYFSHLLNNIIDCDPLPSILEANSHLIKLNESGNIVISYTYPLNFLIRYNRYKTLNWLFTKFTYTSEIVCREFDCQSVEQFKSMKTLRGDNIINYSKKLLISHLESQNFK